MQPKVEINQGLMKLYIIFLRQVSIPFVQMIVFCHAELLICATVLQHRLSIAIVFLSFQIQDNEYDIRGTAQYGPMLSHLYCLMCLLQMCQHQLQDEAASCGVANMLKVLATLRRNKHAQEINACAGRPFAQRSIDRFSLFPHLLTALYWL